MATSTKRSLRAFAWFASLFVALSLLALTIAAAAASASEQELHTPTFAIQPLSPLESAPAVQAVIPPDQAVDVSLDAVIVVTFTEPVTLTAAAMELVCERSGLHQILPTGGPIAFTFVPETALLPEEMCVATLKAEHVSDLDDADPPDKPTSDYFWTFTTGSGIATQFVINEVDAFTEAGRGDFVELFDGGIGEADLSGLVLVLYRGDSDEAYFALDLDGLRADAEGYFLLGARDVVSPDVDWANDILLDRDVAVALFADDASSFPSGAPITTTNLIDAIVYSDGEVVDPELQILLAPGEPALNEGPSGLFETVSNQRCPNGQGGQRRTSGFVPAQPTPRGPNRCPADAAPVVIATEPANGAVRVPRDATLTLTFSEPVALDDRFLELDCERSGRHAFTLSGNGQHFFIAPTELFDPGELCRAYVFGEAVHDSDTRDPPDMMLSDYFWSFTVVRPVAENVLINEVDADTPGVDQAEFIELYDGGVGGTSLDGLVVVFFNGSSDTSYRAVGLDGYLTDANGYFLLANAGVPGVDLSFPDSSQQNGPDAVALIAGSPRQYPGGTPVPATAPLDAFVYGKAGDSVAGLLPLLLPGQRQVDENGRGKADDHSNQRCPNGSGGHRMTSGYKQNTPTPKAVNDCLTDDAPGIKRTLPVNEATQVEPAMMLTVEFSEAVRPADGWLTLSCSFSGSHTVRTSGGPMVYSASPTPPPAYDEWCTATVHASAITDADEDDPPDVMAGDYTWRFRTRPPIADFVVINELDSDTPGSDAAEFVELYDGGIGRVPLRDLVLVFYNGNTDTTYRAIDLDNYSTDANGYFVVGNPALGAPLSFADGTLQNGPDAVALYVGSSTDFRIGTPITTRNLVDAVVYGRPTDVDEDLLRLLHSNESQVDEGARGLRDQHSLQRCPNGAGGARRTAGFRANTPTPGRAGDCPPDDAPGVLQTIPEDGAAQVSVSGLIQVTFSEPVSTHAGWFEITCSQSGRHAADVTGGLQTYFLQPTVRFSGGETCVVRLVAGAIRDLDSDDPPDSMAMDYEWHFSTAGPVADFVLINEVDSDTPDSDTAEFIELYDGGRGNIDLTGMVLVLYNGKDDRSYRAIDLDGHRTNRDGYFLIANTGVVGSQLVLPDGSLQNGADAVGLYEGDAVQFPTGTGVKTAGLLDAVVYGTADDTDLELLALLNPSQPQIDESGRGQPSIDSSQRCPNGQGGRRNTAPFRPHLPTPGRVNNCVYDQPPSVVQVFPPDASVDTSTGGRLAVEFSEPVELTDGWFRLECGDTTLAVNVHGGPVKYELVPVGALPGGAACSAKVVASAVHDLDTDDPPDSPVDDYLWRFSTVSAPVADFVLINELDANTPGRDADEFVELYDGGRGNTRLDGLVLVFWNGASDQSYRTINLSGFRTDAQGYFVVGNPNVSDGVSFADGVLQNGPDAVALYAATAALFPNGSAPTVEKLIDAVLYGPDDDTERELQLLINSGQVQVDEASAGSAERDSLQRCPNGAGGRRNTASFGAGMPTPGAANVCLQDEAPTILKVSPLPGAVNVAISATLGVTFSEDVVVDTARIRMTCSVTSQHQLLASGGPSAFTFRPTSMPTHGETCTVTMPADAVTDADSYDPPDHPDADFTWTFSFQPREVADFIVINEIDPNTPGRDTLEFIEVYDGGIGGTDLSGLVIVFWNGSTFKSYRTISLDGMKTDAAGYFTMGNPGVLAAGLGFANGALQNGPDAVSLHIGPASDFPTGTTLSTMRLLDAVVYGSNIPTDNELLQLLKGGDSAADESGRGAPERDSLQRCPDESGAPDKPEVMLPSHPTPGSANNCYQDEAPTVMSVWPPPAAVDMAITATLSVTFSEHVILDDGWFTLHCDDYGHVSVLIEAIAGSAFIRPRLPLPANDVCLAEIAAEGVHDVDFYDPPDTLETDFSWSFRTVAQAPQIVASFFSNSPVWIDKPVEFTNTSMGSPLLSFLWDFGDGSQASTETNPSHRYAAPGIYTVTLLVIDTTGTDVARQQVLVRPHIVYLPEIRGAPIVRVFLPTIARAGP